MTMMSMQERPPSESPAEKAGMPKDDDALFADEPRCGEEPCGECAFDAEDAEECEQGAGECHNAELGRRGEDAAARYLERKGFEILERNWTCAYGEADIIAQSEDTLVFVEVKTRSNTDKGLPEEAVDKKKRKRYEMIAASFLETYDAVDIAVRFDVVAILVVGGDRALLRHHISAFTADE